MLHGNSHGVDPQAEESQKTMWASSLAAGLKQTEPEDLIGKLVMNISIGKDIAFINFTDGTTISVAHNGERISMMYDDKNVVTTVKSWQEGK